MMSYTSFMQSPWKRENTHSAYKNSSLSMNPAPEYANSEVLLSSLYRTIGFANVGDPVVPQNGRNLDKKIQTHRDRRQPLPTGTTVDLETWNAMLHGVLESPKLPNQSTKRFLQVVPLVPQLSVFSGSARLSSNSWPAGNLIRRMVWLGCESFQEAETLWKELFEALSVSADDDVFARWLEEEAECWTEESNWKLIQPTKTDIGQINYERFKKIKFMPAKQFVKDLRAIIGAKNLVTRRQWTSLLESILRIAAVSHITWLCDVHSRIWKQLSDALHDRFELNAVEIFEEIYPSAPQYMTYGGKALNGIKDKVSSYLTARLGINNLLWALEESGKPFNGEIDSPDEIFNLCKYITQNRKKLQDIDAIKNFFDLKEKESRALNCKKGIGSNLVEFSRHVLGQRQTSVLLLRGYDQGSILRKKSIHSSSPWVVSLGPVAVLALVHCSLSGMSGPRSVYRLGQHLGAYGVAVDGRDISRNDLGAQLRMLGLVLDSPDAESGMLLLQPFAQINKESGND
jgi:hypothetical protein